MPSSWVADQRDRAKSPLSSPPIIEHRFSDDSSGLDSAAGPSGSSSASQVRPSAQMHRNIPPLDTGLTPPAQLLSQSSARSPAYSSTLASPCFVHSHLDSSLSDFVKRDAARDASSPSSARRKLKAKTTEVAEALSKQGETAVLEDESETASEGESDDPEAPSLTRQLAETAVSVRQMSKQLGAWIRGRIGNLGDD